MIKKCKKRNASPRNKINSEVGIICGVNIKPLKVKYKSSKDIKFRYARKYPFGDKNLHFNVATWALFIHIRMESGDQYDAIFKIDKTACDRFAMRPVKLPRGKFVTIPIIFRICGVEEWVELPGKKLEVLTATDDKGEIVSLEIRALGKGIIPICSSHFEITKNKFEPEVYVERKKKEHSVNEPTVTESIPNDDTSEKSSQQLADILFWVLGHTTTSVNQIKKKFRIGNRAYEFMDVLKNMDIVSDQFSKQPRKVIPNCIDNLSAESKGLLVHYGYTLEQIQEIFEERDENSHKEERINDNGN